VRIEGRVGELPGQENVWSAFLSYPAPLHLWYPLQ
jgi:hypothetical protein